MDDLDRPELGLDIIEQIDVEMHRQDMRFWPVLKGLQLPKPETQKAYAQLVFNEGPMPPRRPQKLSTVLGDYATALFQVEASRYPRLDPQFTHWLERLAERVQARTIERVEQVEAGNPTNSLAYHGLSIEAMRTAIATSLHEAVKAWPQSADFTPTLRDPVAGRTWAQTHFHVRNSQPPIGRNSQVRSWRISHGLSIKRTGNGRAG
jgi:hypothetical protein